MLFLILLGDPVGHRKHLTVAGIGERKADCSRAPLFAGATPRDALPSEVSGFEFLLLLRGLVELNPLILGEPIYVFVDERLQPLGRGHLKEDRGHLIGRLAGNTLLGCLRFPGVGDVH
jgi:hypothetical protein